MKTGVFFFPIVDGIVPSDQKKLTMKRGDALNVVTNFYERKQKKQLQFERGMLKELNLSKIEKDVRKQFSPFFYSSLLFQEDMEEVCVDMAIEAYLSGGSYSKFRYYGETAYEVRARSSHDRRLLALTLYDDWIFWLNGAERLAESLYGTCETFVDQWWREGLNKGEKRLRLRLH